MSRARSNQRPIFLIGYMGSGKTTLGKAVSTRASVDFVDLDEYIVDEAGMTVNEIFAAEGEDGFRQRERRALHALGEASGLRLIACGGGTPCYYDNAEWMNAHGTTVRLDASVDTLVARLMLLRDTRPLIRNLSDSELRDFIVKALAAREPYYSRAVAAFDANRLDDAEQVAESVERFVNTYLTN